jgi:hypothetical protein
MSGPRRRCGQAGTGQAAAPGAARSQGGGAQQDALAWYGDSAYGTADLRQAIGQAGHQAVIKPGPLQSAVPGGFTIDDFTVDEQAGVLTCPDGITRSITPGNVISGAACGACPVWREDKSDTARTARPEPVTDCSQLGFPVRCAADASECPSFRFRPRPGSALGTIRPDGTVLAEGSYVPGVRRSSLVHAQDDLLSSRHQEHYD